MSMIYFTAYKQMLVVIRRHLGEDGVELALEALEAFG